jgi:hypothetical protein
MLGFLGVACVLLQHSHGARPLGWSKRILTGSNIANNTLNNGLTRPSTGEPNLDALTNSRLHLCSRRLIA